jgi:hypothetical protein
MRTPSRTRAVTALALLPFLALAACNSKPTVIQAQDDSDDMKTAVANAAPVTLPPSILATKTFRCADNSVVTVDFYGDNASAAIHQKEGLPITLKAPAAGQPMTGSDYVVDGKATDSTVKITEPGKAAQSCDDQ